ncbi:hypothetical protein Taro_001931 [Colocasia esculenta]|uniref:C3H1-type domain-containing protein n=1 Tax=Colocasia esculenta TaxID=4460 RepID=A0A843TFX0_COLES|nr:hypothetical protein [Colocasia esculenta]
MASLRDERGRAAGDDRNYAAASKKRKGLRPRACMDVIHPAMYMERLWLVGSLGFWDFSRIGQCSTAGCSFGEGCHFLHYVPGGINAAAKMINLSSPSLSISRNTMVPSVSDLPTPPLIKTPMCNNYNTPGGYKYGDKCQFAHGERELGRPTLQMLDDDSMGPIGGRLGVHIDPPTSAGVGAAGSFGASASAKISVDASLAGAIIGEAGVNSKQICRLSGAKLSIREHETDPNLRNIELEGTFDRIKQAGDMIQELIGNLSATIPLSTKNLAPTSAAPGSNYKTKLCVNFFRRRPCTFGDRCRFAHGAAELRKPGV